MRFPYRRTKSLDNDVHLLFSSDFWGGKMNKAMNIMKHWNVSRSGEENKHSQAFKYRNMLLKNCGVINSRTLHTLTKGSITEL